MAATLRIQLVGAESDAKDVRFSEFLAQLEAIKTALKETESFLGGASVQPMDYRVVDLEHNSPATLVLAPIVESQSPVYADRVLRSFTLELRSIRERKRLLVKADMARLDAYGQIGSKPKNHIEEVKIAVMNGSVRPEAIVDQRFKEHLKQIVGPDQIAHGSVSGRLEYINFHNARTFRIYPEIGPKRVTGVFPPHLREEVRAGVDRFVTVYGKLRYKTWDAYPYQIDADMVDVHEPDESLPTFRDLKGIAPKLTGELTSVDWVRKIRDEDW